MLKKVEGTFALSRHSASLGQTDQAALARVRGRYAEAPLMPPSTEEVYEQSGLHKAVVRNFLEKLINEKVLVRISREFLFEREAVEQARDKVRRHLAEHGTMTVSEFRDLVGTSRKFAIPLLTYFDNQGHTVRDGDLRRPGPNQG